MLYRKLTSTGDYSFGQNLSDFHSGTQAVAQAIKTKILLFYQEWWEQLDDGIPMFESIIGQYNIENVKLAVSRLVSKRILEVPDVTEIVDLQLEVDRESRKIQASFTVNTTFGEIESEVVV